LKKVSFQASWILVNSKVPVMVAFSNSMRSWREAPVRLGFWRADVTCRTRL
jgi:hypothetical protein